MESDSLSIVRVEKRGFVFFLNKSVSLPPPYCKRFSPTPPKPVVSLPATSDFGEILTMDLKEVKVGPYRYIFHMIDAFTRFAASFFITNKTPDTIVSNMCTSWVANYGRPKKCWSDVRGEFNNNTACHLDVV